MQPLVMALLFCVATDTKPPTIVHDEVEIAVRERDVVVTAKIDDADGVFDPVVLYRVGKTGTFSRIGMTESSPGVYRATINGKHVVADVEYVVEAYDNEGNGPSRHGTEELPVVVQVVEPSEAKIAPPTTASPVDETVVPEEEEGSGWVLGAALGGTALIVVVVAVAATAAVVGYIVFSQPGPPVDDDVTLVVTSDSPLAVRP